MKHIFLFCLALTSLSAHADKDFSSNAEYEYIVIMNNKHIAYSHSVAKEFYVEHITFSPRYKNLKSCNTSRSNLAAAIRTDGRVLDCYAVN